MGCLLFLWKRSMKDDLTTLAPRFADILIIGGGLSGTMLAAQLLRLPGRREVLIVEPRSELGRGEAYSAVEQIGRAHV